MNSETGVSRLVRWGWLAYVAIVLVAGIVWELSVDVGGIDIDDRSKLSLGELALNSAICSLMVLAASLPLILLGRFARQRWRVSKLRPVDYVGAVVLLAVVTLVLFASLGGFQDGKADATFIGDSTAAGARVFIDGQFVGALEGRVVDGRMTPWLRTRVKLGPRRLVAVSVKGDSMSGAYESHASGIASVAFPVSEKAK